MALKYATTLQFASVLGIKKDVPSWNNSERPEPELVGTGDASTLIFYLKHKNIIASSYTIYYGADFSSMTALTETTHYKIS